MACVGDSGGIGPSPTSNDDDNESFEAAASGQIPRGAHSLGPVVFAQLQAKSSAAGSDFGDDVGTATGADDGGSAAGSDDGSESEMEGPGEQFSPNFKVFAPPLQSKSAHHWKRFGGGPWLGRREYKVRP